MFAIKICGVTTAADAHLVALAGADAIGLNFYPASARYLTPSQAQDVVAAVPASVAKVGVFVNAEPHAMRGIAAMLQLDYLQFHGDEPAEWFAAVAPWPVVRAVRWSRELSVAAAHEMALRLSRHTPPPAALLIDALVPAAYGGSGQSVDWPAVAPLARASAIPVLLAGGLTPANVAEAIAIAQPAGVDVASGVERAPGQKDPDLVRQFVRHAREALDRQVASTARGSVGKTGPAH